MSHQLRSSNDNGNFLKKLKGDSPALQTLGIFKSSKNWQDVGIPLDGDGLSTSLYFQFKDGSTKFVFYHDMASPVEYSSKEGIRIEISSNKYDAILIKGRNLVQVVEYLALQKVDWIKERDSSTPIVDDKEPFIERIEFFKRDLEGDE